MRWKLPENLRGKGCEGCEEGEGGLGDAERRSLGMNASV